MPELPEVETTRRGIAPHLLQQQITAVAVRQPQLRWPVSPELAPALTGAQVIAVARRAKYLLLQTAQGHALVHLGMSGSLCVTPQVTPPGKHDHLDLVLANGRCLRYHDPRRFGAWLWTERPLAEHPLLAKLGPEPLEAAFDGAYLYARSRGRRSAVKLFIMDSQVVVGVGNIYANEALFSAGISPWRAAGRISLARYQALAQAIRQVLSEAIAQGGTTLRDFTSGEGRPGYFKQSLKVYGRAGAPCRRCGQPIALQRQVGRASYHCPRCQR